MKYLIILESPQIEPIEKFLHIPVDNIIINAAGIGSPGCCWSKINREQYIQFQNRLKAIVPASEPAYHAFFNDTDGGLLGGTIKAKSYAASEVDLELTWKMKEYLTLMGGWSGIFRSGNNPSTVCQNQNWCWLQINVNPRMFFTKW